MVHLTHDNDDHNENGKVSRQNLEKKIVRESRRLSKLLKQCFSVRNDTGINFMQYVKHHPLRELIYLFYHENEVRQLSKKRSNQMIRSE